MTAEAGNDEQDAREWADEQAERIGRIWSRRYPAAGGAHKDWQGRPPGLTGDTEQAAAREEAS